MHPREQGGAGTVATLALLAITLLPPTPAQAAKPGSYHWAPGAGQVSQAGGLSVRVLGPAYGVPVVMLHGIAGSKAYFGAAYDVLADRARLIAPDLSGYGATGPQATGYGVDDQAQAVLRCLDALQVQRPAVLVGLSFGTNIAIRLAVTHPERVACVLGTAPMVFPDRSAAIAGLGRLDPVTRLIATDPAIGTFVAGWASTNQARAAAIARAVDPALPGPIAEAAVGTPPEVLQASLRAGLIEAPVPTWIAASRVPIRLLVGDADPTPDRRYLAGLAAAHPMITIVPVRGADHHVLLARPDVGLAEIKRAITVARLKVISARP